MIEERDAQDWREGIGFEPISRDVTYPTMPNPTPGAPSSGIRSKAFAPAPPERRTPGLTHQSSAPLPPPASPPIERTVCSRTPPPKQRMAVKPPANVPKGRAHDKTPNIFYTRPNPSRTDRNIQRQHHPV